MQKNLILKCMSTVDPAKQLSELAYLKAQSPV
jgi:hypothetical protein